MIKVLCRIGIFILETFIILTVIAILPSPITLIIGTIVWIYLCCAGIKILKGISQKPDSANSIEQRDLTKID